MAVGILTDGDLRRALIRGESMEAPVVRLMNTTFLSVSPDATRVHALDLMRSRGLGHVPILDASKDYVGLHALRDVVGVKRRSEAAVIMAGGRGMRLRPLTETLPKPMVKVAGRPILERLVIHLMGHGIERIFIAVNYLSDVIEDHFGDGERFGCSIAYLRENEPMGSGGALSLLPGELEGAVLVLNGDLVCDADVGGMLDFHSAGSFYATMGYRPHFHRVEYGCVEVQSDRLLAIQEKPVIEKLVNAGVYVVSEAALTTVPHGPFPITDLFAEGLGGGRKCGAFAIENDWIDVGSREQLAIARSG